MKTLGNIAMVAGLGASLMSVANAQDILLFGSNPEAAVEQSRHPGGFDRPMSSRDHGGAGGFYSGRSVSAPNRNAIGQGVGRD